jgi:ribosomal protein S18 acetylase RimI-like enzyme
MCAVTEITSRAWAGPDDLRAMEGLLSAAWNGPRRPLVPVTVGDLEWWFALGGPDVDWSKRIRIWEVGGHIVAWGWFKPPIETEWFVSDALDEVTRIRVADSLLTWHEQLAHEALARIPVATPPDGGPPRLEKWAADGWPEAALLAARGWSPGDLLLTQYFQPFDVELDPPRVPDGYTLRTLRGPNDVPARVEVHRAAFAPSQLTVEKYEIAVRQEHYAFERDVVVEASDGSFAAFALCWLDPVSALGYFELVGVHPDHQRRGLGRVVMRQGLRLLREAGAHDAMVFSLRSNAASEALYRSAGFDEIAIHRIWTKTPR